MGCLDGKVGLVTGAGQGAGMGIALELAAEGAAVAAVGRTLSKVESVAETIRSAGGSAIAIQCDVGLADAIDPTVERVVSEFGTIDVLANVAQSDVRRGRLLEMDEGDVDLLWRTGPLATWRFMRSSHQYLVGGGSIINIGSGAQFAPENLGMYAAVKDAIRALTRTAAVEWGPDGIRANLIVPHTTSPAQEAYLETPGRREEVLSRIPIGRFGQPADIGKVAVFLASSAADMVTGGMIMVDGGRTYFR